MNREFFLLSTHVGGSDHAGKSLTQPKIVIETHVKKCKENK